jgi:hypothetical protein
MDELKADMELASMKGFVEDILTGRAWFKDVGIMGKYKFVQFQLRVYEKDLDRALDLVVWHA